MTSDAPSDGGKHVTPNTACARSQPYTTDWVFKFAEITLQFMMLGNFSPFVGPNIILNGPIQLVVNTLFAGVSLFADFQQETKPTFYVLEWTKGLSMCVKLALGFLLAL